MPEKSAYNCSQLTAHSSPRIVSLDTAKGIAIILVVIGHELQHRYGTDGLPFRLIYSFHMPLFMFLSGMVFSLKLRNFPSQSLKPSREILKSARGLLIPFVCWTLVAALIRHRDNMAGYFLRVAESPDRSLWFLLVLFWCRAFFVLVHRVCARAFRNLTAMKLAAVMAVMFVLMRLLAPGNFMGAGLFRAHFPYFALGVFAWQYRVRLSGFLADLPAVLAMIALFAVIAPCWHLTEPNPFSLAHGRVLFLIVRRLSPIPGIFLTLSLTRFLARCATHAAVNALCMTGTMTLGIYALHPYFLGMFPPVIAPLCVSVLLTVVIGRIPVMRVLLLGK